MNISIVGVGYVGLVTGACFADLGNTVWCIDVDKKKITSLKEGKIPIYEPQLQEIVQENKQKGRLFFTTSIAEGIKESEVVFIAVGTPSAPNGEADLTNVEQVAIQIGRNLDHDMIIANKSTVPVGTGDLVTRLIKENLKKIVRFAVVSNPEFLREGSAVYDFMFPDRVVIGDDTGYAGEILAQLYRPLQCPIIITDVISSEMIKYSSNAYLAMEISFINEIANICDRVGADVKSVVQGMGLDKRINPAFLNPGVGFGGSCFPKDTRAIVEIAKRYGYDFKTIKAVIEVNDMQRYIVIDKIKHFLGELKGKKIGIWGLSFKPNTDDIREAPAFYIIKRLLEEGVFVSAYDPAAEENMKMVLPEIEYKKSSYDAVKDADGLIIVTDWNEFKNVNLVKLKSIMKNPVVIDGRNIYSPSEMKAMGFKYSGIGR
ncbi:MAG: UDP-glucose dehydrogenase family protein [bacterium]